MIWLRRVLIFVLSVLVLLAIAVAALVWNGERKRMRTVQLPALSSPAFADSAAARERGQYLYASRGCADCHGADGAGRVFVDNPNGLRLKGPAIHSASAVVAGYTAADWDRVIRHGVKRDGRPVMIMPCEDYNRFTDADLAAVVAYTRALPPAGGGAAVIELPLPVRALYGAGAIQDAAAKLDHTLPTQQPVPEGVTVEHGRYVANTCKGCHGPQLAGGKVPGGPPDWPPAARLNAGPDSVMPRYADADAMIAMFRSGKRPDGSAVQVMPFESFSKMSDTDLRALHLYLKSLPAN
jgi:mono/diheme cytochrome c family protein